MTNDKFAMTNGVVEYIRPVDECTVVLSQQVVEKCELFDNAMTNCLAPFESFVPLWLIQFLTGQAAFREVFTHHVERSAPCSRSLKNAL